uniref:Uncharacterized protein n=1 Tax=Davidia involucrata TaxID=16924 RepID=A0A5B7BLN0_DAVIN
MYFLGDLNCTSSSFWLLCNLHIQGLHPFWRFVLLKSDKFCYLGLIIYKEKEIRDVVTHRIKVGLFKWRRASSILCEGQMPLNLKGKFYKIVFTPAMFYGT